MNPQILFVATLVGSNFLACTAEVVHHIVRPQPMLIGYYDAQGQDSLPLEEANLQHLTHVVLANAVRVDKHGELHFRPSHSPGDLHGREVIRNMTSQPGPALIVSIRGFPDDVALDELSEKDEARQRFVSALAEQVQDWHADGLEIEWHADDALGGKPRNTPFDDEERAHLAMLCRDMHETLKPLGRTLSVAVRPGRMEFDSNIEGLADWLAVRAYSMRSLGDPHHSSVKDADTALNEWLDRGVEPRRLVLATPLFARPGAALRLAHRDHALREPWSALISGEGFQVPPLNDKSGDIFLDRHHGTAWWASGFNTTRAKVMKVLDGGFGGIALRDLHHDADGEDSLLQFTVDTVQKYFDDIAADAERKKVHKVSLLKTAKTGVVKGISLMQSGFRLSSLKSDEM